MCRCYNEDVTDMQQKGDTMNKKQLRQKCLAKGFNLTELPEKVGISKATFYRKSNSNNFTVKDVKAIKEILSLTDRDVRNIFFDFNVS